MSLRATILSASISALVLIACDRSSSAPKVDPEKPAGTVIELAGTVVAKRASAPDPRQLAKGAPVWSDDTVTTSADSSVQIRLAHNDALFALSAGKSRVLAESVAWKAAPGSRGALDKSEGDVTSIAGHPAERTSANTAATAMGPATGDGEARSDDKKGAPGKSDTVEDDLDNTDREGDTRQSTQTKSESKPDSKPKGERLEAKADSGGGADLPEKLTSNQVRKVLATLDAPIQQCARKASYRGETKVRFSIALGRVVSVKVSGVDSPAVKSCIEATLKKARFEKARRKQTISRRYRFR